MDLLTLRDIRGLQISPDGKYVAFVLIQAVYETNHYRSGMFVISTEKGSKPISLGTAGSGRWDEGTSGCRKPSVVAGQPLYLPRYEE